MAEIKGWCPNVFKPMQLDDGLIMRVKPPMGRINKHDTHILAQISQEFGNSQINLTNRANLQIRGLTDESYTDALTLLRTTELFTENPEIEARRNIMISPVWHSSDMNTQVYTRLRAALDVFPYVNDKFGYAVDCGSETYLDDTPYDLRFLYDGQNIFTQPKGCDLAIKSSLEDFINVVDGLIKWFNTTGHRRMHQAIEDGLPKDMTFTLIKITEAQRPEQMTIRDGLLSAETLMMLADKQDFLQLTPWRGMILL